MTFDEVLEVIMFIVGGVVLAWAFRSLALASSGGERSGMHELGMASVSEISDSDDASDTEEESSESEAKMVKSAGTQRLHQASNYLLSLAAMGALAAMLIGAYLS
jgi:hypothetical protein